jgi:hypothetical protein
MAAFDIIYAWCAIEQFMFDIWYIALCIKVTKKDRPACK